MKIGIFNPYLDSLTGGEKYMLTLATCLAKQHQVSIIWDPKDEDYIKKIAKEKFNIDLTTIPFHKNIFAKNSSLRRRLEASKKFDAILYLSDGSIPFVFSKLYLHFQFPTEWIQPSIKTKAKLLLVKKIFCNSLFTKQLIDKKFGVESVVIYPPADVYRDVTIKKENIILHVGRFEINKEGEIFKKQDVLIAVYEKMVKEGIKGWEFVLVVSVRKKDMAAFETFQQKVKNAKVTFIVNCDNKTLFSYYNKAKIYWHATGFGADLEKNPEKAEHFGISTVEAMGAGAVPIVINAGGQKEIVSNEKNGFLWDTQQQLEEKTQQLILDTKQWEKMSKDAIGRARFFDIQRFCNDVARLLQ